MGYVGVKPSAVPLTSADITDNVITSAKIVDGTITNTDIASSIITGQTAETSIAGGDQILIYDDSATALRKMTRTNFVAGIGGTNTPAFLATTNVSNSTTGAATLFAFNVETFDTDNCYDNTASNYRFTPNVAGKYFLYTQTLPYNVGPTYNLTDRQLYIMKNGSVIARCTQLTSLGSTYAEEMNCSVIGEANGTTDYFDVRYEITVGSSTLQHDGGACNFFGFKLI